MRTGEAEEISPVLPYDLKIRGGKFAKSNMILNGRKTAKTEL